MSKQTQSEIDQMIQRARSTNRDLVRRDINQGIHSPVSNLVLKLVEYYFNDGTSKELLSLAGTVACQYRGSRYNIPIEIWIQQDHPNSPPLAYVKPTVSMHVSPSSKDVQPDGTVVIPYLKKWRHPNSDITNLLNAMSEAFSLAPPVYSNTGGGNQPTPYPANSSSMPMPGGGNVAGGNTSYSYPHGYPQTQLTPDVYRESIQSAVLDKVRYRVQETVQLGNAQIDSLRKTEQDLTDGDKNLQLLITDAQQQQIQAQNYITNIKAKTSEMSDAAHKMSSSGNEHSVKEDALVTPAPVYKQLLQAYAEEHAIQDLLYYLADGLRKESIGLDIYLKHVRELSRRQFILRATMHRCRQVAGLPVK